MGWVRPHVLFKGLELESQSLRREAMTHTGSEQAQSAMT